MICIKRIVRDDSAVSETLGFILIFGIALTAIAIILLVGNSIIDSEKSRDNFQNMVQSFSIVQSDMKQVALDGTPVKTTMLHMESGSLSMNPATARLKVYDNSGGGSTLFYTNDTGMITFTAEKDTANNVSYEDGGVWKAADGYSYMISQPRMYIMPQTDTLVLNVFRLQSASGPQANSGTGTMTIGTSYVKTSVLPTYTVANPAAPDGVVLQIDTKYKEAWKDYLDNIDIGTPGVTAYVSIDTYPDGIEAKFTGVKYIVVSEHWVNVQFSGLYN